MGHLGDCEWKKTVNNRVYRKRSYDDSFHISTNVNISRKSIQPLEEYIIEKWKDCIYLFYKH